MTVDLPIDDVEIIKIEKGIPGKKYTVFYRNKNNGKEGKVSFGSTTKKYAQFKDSTGLGLYSKQDHGDIERRVNYWKRQKPDLSRFNANTLSAIFLW